MVLRRLGNKTKSAAKIQAYFPEFDTYFEPFFGAGGMFFNLQASPKYVYLNDLDRDVVNLFDVIINDREALHEYLRKIPYHKELFLRFRKDTEEDAIKRAAHFLVRSNWSYMGTGDTINFGRNNSKRITLENIQKTYDFLLSKNNVQFNNCDFRVFIKQFPLKDDRVKNKVFIYADPPYLDTTNNYSHSFKPQDSTDLFDTLQASGCKFAVSEFDHPHILKEAKERGLNIIEIGERLNLKNRRTEMLYTNY